MGVEGKKKECLVLGDRRRFELHHVINGAAASDGGNRRRSDLSFFLFSFFFLPFFLSHLRPIKKKKKKKKQRLWQQIGGCRFVNFLGASRMLMNFMGLCFKLRTEVVVVGIGG